MFIEDDKLPQDVVRKKLSDTRDALCCLECGFESAFSSMDKDAIGRPPLRNGHGRLQCR
jgi:hypothetical protein